MISRKQLDLICCCCCCWKWYSNFISFLSTSWMRRWARNWIQRVLKRKQTMMLSFLQVHRYIHTHIFSHWLCSLPYVFNAFVWCIRACMQRMITMTVSTHMRRWQLKRILSQKRMLGQKILKPHSDPCRSSLFFSVMSQTHVWSMFTVVCLANEWRPWWDCCEHFVRIHCTL